MERDSRQSRHKKKKKTKPGKLQTILSVVMAALFLFACLVFFAFRDEIDSSSLDSLLSTFNFRTTTTESEVFHFDPGQKNRYELCAGGLAVLSPERLAFYGNNGYEKYSRAVSYETPALTSSGNRIIAYDRTGEGAIIAGGGGIEREFDSPVFTATGNSRGQYVLVTKEPGYRATATVYNKKNNPTYTWRSSSYITAAGLSPSSTRLVTAGIRYEETMNTKLTFLDTGKEDPIEEIILTDTLVLAVYFPDNSRVCIISENCVYFYTDTGIPIGEYSLDQLPLLRFFPTSEVLLLQTGRHETGYYSKVIALGYDGNERGVLSFEEAPAALSAGGKFFSVLREGRLDRYVLPSTFTNDKQHEDLSAKGVIQQDDGSALLLYEDYARWAKWG
ncbi:MAG: DUF5711 family protein [Oscillospiraceae bacterium]|nr:DUF5711 family protein [Oscillospiraceae bacterium]